MKETKHYASKTIIIHILAVLKKYTSETAPVSYTQVAKFLRDIGKPCDRKTVIRNVDYLIAEGFPIVKTEDARCYYQKVKK